MAEAIQKSESHYLDYFFSCVLGYISLSVILIVYNQIINSANHTSTATIILLTIIFCGLMLGLLLALKYNDFLQAHTNSLLLCNIFYLGCFFSTLFLQLLRHLFSEQVFFLSYIALSGIYFSQLGCLIGNIFINAKKKHIYYLVMYILGLLLGLLMTEIIILNLLGISWAIFSDGCLLLICALLYIQSFTYEIVTLSIIAALLVILFGINIHLNQDVNFNVTYQGLDLEKFTPVMQDQSIISSLLKSDTNAPYEPYPYMPLLKKIIYQNLNLSDKKVLVIGDDNYLLTHDDYKNIHFTYLNFANDKLPSACVYLGMVEKGDRIFSAGKNQLNQLGQSYAAIISNVFPNNFSIPRKLLSYQYMFKIRNALATHGIAIFNIVARPTLSDLYSKRVDNTIRAVFPDCMKIPFNYSELPTNILYICHKSAEDKDNSIYTANLTAKTSTF